MSIATKRAYLKVLAGGGGTFMRHIKMFRAALAAFVTVVLTGQSLAVDIFVSPTGNGEKTGANWSNALNGSNDGWHIDVKNAITGAVAGGAEEINVYLAAGDYTITNQLALSSITIPVKFCGGYVGTTDGDLTKGETATTLKRNTSYNTRFINATSLSDLTIEGMSFSGGKVVGNVQGGAVYLASSNTLVDNCIFSKNITGKGDNSYYVGKGAALFATGGTLTVKDSSFNQNGMTGSYYPHWGGALCTLKTDVLIDGCVFDNNYAKPDKLGGIGGAVCINGFTAKIKNTSFTGNYSTSGSSDNSNGPLGGALAVRSVTKLEMSDCYFANNYITCHGSADRIAGCCYFDDYNKADGVMTSAVTRCVFDSSSIATTTRAKTDILLNHGCLFMTNCLVTHAKGNHSEMISSVRATKAALAKVASNKQNGSQNDLVAQTNHAGVDKCLLEVVNSTIADGKGTGILGVGEGVEIYVKNCISYGHSLTGVVNATSIEYSYIQTNDDGAWNYQGTGNLNPDVVGDINWTGYPYYHLLTKKANGAITNGWFSGTFESPKCAADSPCIDAGAPGSVGLDLEPYYSGRRVNIGAYGGTPWASKTSPLPGFKLIIR